MEGFDKEFVIVIAELCELAIVLDDGQRIEHDEQEQCHESLPSLLALDLEYLESFFIMMFAFDFLACLGRRIFILHFFRKNLTKRKLTGMQTQSVGNMAICLVSPMPTKRFRQTVCRV